MPKEYIFMVYRGKEINKVQDLVANSWEKGRPIGLEGTSSRALNPLGSLRIILKPIS